MSKNIGIVATCPFGRTYDDSKLYDMRDEVGRNMIDYQLIEIKCQIKANGPIYGIQFIYKNKNNDEKVALINVKPKEPFLIQQSISLKDEEVSNLRIWISNDTFQLIGFEITTNKGKSQKFGYGKSEELRIISVIENKEKTIVGFAVYADDQNGITSMYAYYLNKKLHAFYSNIEIFKLRILSKKSEEKKKYDELLPKMNETNKILYKISILPDNQFFNIIKYILS